MLNWLQKLLKGFGEFLNDPTWNNFKLFLSSNWAAILLLIILIFVLSYIVSKIFEIVVKIALTIFFIWFIFMFIFRHAEFKEMMKNWGQSLQNNSSN